MIRSASLLLWMNLWSATAFNLPASTTRQARCLSAVRKVPFVPAILHMSSSEPSTEGHNNEEPTSMSFDEAEIKLKDEEERMRAERTGNAVTDEVSK